jgi:prophage regulatory protein
MKTFDMARASEAPSDGPSDVRLYRLSDVLDRIPISRSSWFAGIQAGRYPRGYRLGSRITVWRSDDIDRLIEQCTSLNPFAGLLP